MNPNVTFDSKFLTGDEAAVLFQALRAEAAWKQEHLKMFGREVRLPRLTAWYGDHSYRYSGIRNEPNPWIPALSWVKERVDAVCGIKFNSVLLNHYRDGQDSVSWHADDEPELGPVIASVSLGTTRSFQLKHKRRPEWRAAYDLTGGSLLVMHDIQKDWLHRVPKQMGRGERINLTFRFVALTMP